MKKITLLLFIFSFIGTVSFSQTTETFETETTNSTTFTDNGQSFTINDLEPGSGNYDIEEFLGAGWNGSGTDNKFIDNSTGIVEGLDGSSFSITTTDGANITVKSFYLFVSTRNLNVASTTVTITGKKDGATVYTFSKSSGFANPQTFSPNNGFTFIDLATEGGANNAILEVDELIISSTGNADYLALDAFRWAAGFNNAAPVIGGTVANQTVNDTATIQPFSAITTTDADGDNLSATITLDNHAKGVLTGAGLSGTGPYIIASTSPADLQTKLRALSYNPTDNRAAVSETTTFTVLVDDGTDTDSDNTTTVISNAVAPTVTSVSVPTNATYTTGQNLDFTVNFSENVLVSGSPQISITVGSTTRQATYVSGTSSGSLVFRYTVQNGDNDNDGISVGNLALNGGTLRDSGTANANLTLNSVGNTTLVLVDAVAPTVTSVTVPVNGTYISGQNLDFTVNFSENITVNTGGGSPYINITIGSSSKIANFSSGSGNSYTFRYQIQNGDLDTDGISVGIVTTNGATFRDAANNNANLTLNNIGNTSAVLVDAVAPTLSSTNPTDNATDVLLTQNIELSFSENISKGSGNITIFKTSDDSVVETIDVTSGLVSITTTTATINPTDDFELNTEYYVQIATGVFTDTALNAYTGISDKTSLSFTSQANQTNTYSGSGNWSTTANWSLGRLPIASDNVAINFGSTVLFDVASATINNLNISSGTLNMVAGNALTLDGDLSQTGTFNIASSASANASLIVKGTSTGNVSYLRHVSTNWHLIGAPVEGQSISALSGQVNTSDTKYAIAPYKNNTTTLLRWNYYTTAAGTNDIANSGNFISGKGYTIQKSSFEGTISFTGTLNTDNAGESIAITDGGDDLTGNRWNLIANPYTAAINGNNTADATNNFLKVNIDAGNLDPSRAGLYLWTGSAPYDIKSLDDGAFYIAPGQAFFVHAPDGGGTSASFTEAMQTHQTGNIFSKGSSSNYPEIILNLTDGKANSLTKVRYIQNKTTGLDVGSDIGTFTGASSNFGIFSHLLQDSQGVDFAIQALPNSNYENMIVPIGINAEAGKEISFSANIANFPSGVKVFLEDRAHNRFFSLDDEGSKYKITVNNAQNGIGRFYLHTTSSALNVDKSLTLENINVYKLNNSTLRITGLSQERTEVTIFNILGKKVLNTTLKANTLKDIDLPHLSNGIYLVQLKNNSGKLTKKILLE